MVMALYLDCKASRLEFINRVVSEIFFFFALLCFALSLQKRTHVGYYLGKMFYCHLFYHLLILALSYFSHITEPNC